MPSKPPDDARLDAECQRRAQDVQRQRRTQGVQHQQSAQDAEHQQSVQDAERQQSAQDVQHQRSAQDAGHQRSAQDAEHQQSAQEPSRTSLGQPPHATQPATPEPQGTVVPMTVDHSTHHDAAVAPALAHPGPPIPDPIPPVPAVRPDASPVEVPVAPVPALSVHAAPDAAVAPAPTLGEAFQVLCAALAPHFLADAAAYEHCLLIQGWHGPSVANQHVAWSHAMQLLGRVFEKKIEA